jgi:hypothetical protein
MSTKKLYLLIVGCTPPGRNTEQHDAFVGIADSLADLLPQIHAFWPDAGSIHIDSWREVTCVDGYQVTVIPRQQSTVNEDDACLFFLNLGGYKPGDMEEYHYKMLVIAPDKGAAVAAAKKTAFYKHTGFKGALSHIDDKYGVDVDDVHAIKDMLPDTLKQAYSLQLSKQENLEDDHLNIGYVKLSSLLQI